MPTRRHRLLADVRARLADGHAPDDVGRWLADQGCDAREIGDILARVVPHVGDAVPTHVTPPADSGERDDVSDVAEPDDALARAGTAERPGRPRVPGDAPAIRVQGPHERGRFSAEAWGWVLDCATTGIVAAADLESLIDRALFQHDGRIGVSDLRALAEDAGLLPVAGDARTISH